MELERRYVNLNHRKGEAFSQMTMEEDLNVPDQKPDIYKIIHGRENSGRMRSRGRPVRSRCVESFCTAFFISVKMWTGCRRCWKEVCLLMRPFF